MNNKLLTSICVMSITAFAVGSTYACCQTPVASFTKSADGLCVAFDATASYDPDETTLSYSWDFGDGACDITGDDTPTPTCTYGSGGEKTVTLTVTDNDDPECCGSQSGCADKSDDLDHTFTVSFPDGCGNAGPHDSSVHWASPDDDYTSFTCTIFGDFDWDSATYDVDFKSSNCTWICEISNVQAKTTILVRAPASLLPDNVSVESASEVPCDDAAFAKYDLDDTDLSDDEGAPRCKYWCYTATVAHEEKHRYDWQDKYGDALSGAISYLQSTCHSTMDCGTTTCQAAATDWQLTIQQFFNLARTEAVESFNNSDTPLNEADQRAYEISYEIEQPISAALPEGCTP